MDNRLNFWHTEIAADHTVIDQLSSGRVVVNRGSH